MCRLAANQSVTKIFAYLYIFVTIIHSNICSYRLFWFKYIGTFVLAQLICMNIFGHSFVSLSECEHYLNIRMYSNFIYNIKYVCRHSFVSNFLCEYVGTLICVFFFDTNIFKQSFLSISFMNVTLCSKFICSCYIPYLNKSGNENNINSQFMDAPTFSRRCRLVILLCVWFTLRKVILKWKDFDWRQYDQSILFFGRSK